MKPKTKRLDGNKKCILFTAQQEEDIKSYCREKGIESQSELIRQAVVKYIDGEYSDNSLKLIGLREIKESLSKLHDMVSVVFSYQHLMHLNILAYHPEIADELKDAALASAKIRHEKFYSSFQERLRNDPPFFEKLLHKYVSGSLDE